MSNTEEPIKLKKKYLSILSFLAVFFVIIGLSDPSKNVLSFEFIIPSGYPLSFAFAQPDTQNFQNGISLESISNILPPKINMYYNGSIFNGNIVGYEYREGYPFSEVDLRLNLSNHIPKENIPIKNGSEVKFLISGYPDRVEPSELSLSAYKIHNKKINFTDSETRVLNPVNSTDKEYPFKVNFPSGEYFVMVSMTTIPETSDRVGGFAIYSFKFTIT